MVLNKFKLCPTCHEHNPPALLECKKCGTDLTGFEVVDDAILAAQHKPVQNSFAAGGHSRLVKVCDCGAENPPQARKCSACGEDMSDVGVTESRTMGTMPVTKAVFRTVDGSFSFTIEKPVTVIGRESEMSGYLKAKTYVSRRHAKLVIANGDIYIENLSSTNHTFVNNARIPDDTPTLLRSGDEVGLGGKRINGERQAKAAYFIIEVSA
jgi:ribosomal protein L40E